jgi:hypothetical protein
VTGPGRVLVTVRCRRKGHVLAELAATGEGGRVLRMRHHAVLLIGEDGRVRQQPGVHGGDPLWHSLPWPPPGGAAAYPEYFLTVSCACGAPYVVNAADLEAASVNSVTAVIADPMR